MSGHRLMVPPIQIGLGLGLCLGVATAIGGITGGRLGVRKAAGSMSWGPKFAALVTVVVMPFFLGSFYAPLFAGSAENNPAKPGFKPPEALLPVDTTARLNSRSDLLGGLNRGGKSESDAGHQSWRDVQRRGFEIATSDGPRGNAAQSRHAGAGWSAKDGIVAHCGWRSPRPQY